MALSYTHGAIQWLTTDALNADLTASGFGFQPKAIRFYWMGIQSSTDATSRVTSQRGTGFTDGTTHRVICATSIDAAGNADTAGHYATNGVVLVIDGAGAQTGKLSLQSIDSGGFTLNVDDVTPQAITVFYEAWGGSDITNVTVGNFSTPGATGTQNYTATGFTSTDDDSQVVMFSGQQGNLTAGTGAAQDSGFYYGISTGASGENIVVMCNSDEGSANMDTERYGISGECIAMSTAADGTINERGGVSAFGTDVFTVNWTERAVTRTHIYMAIKGGQWKVGETTIDATTNGATATVSGLAFAPVGISLISVGQAESTADTVADHETLSFGSGSSTSSRRSLGITDQHGASSAVVQVGVEYDQVLNFQDTGSGTTTSIIDINAMNSDGFQLISESTTGVNPLWIGYLAFGDDPGGGVESTAISVSGESSNTFTGAGTAAVPISMIAESVVTLEGSATQTSDISIIAESINTLEGASTNTTDIFMAGESVNTLEGASTAEAPITSTGESIATLEGTSTAEAVISMTGESVATLEGVGLGGIQSGDISMIAESVVTLEGASTAEAPIAASGESVVTLDGASTAEAVITASGESINTLEGVEVSAGFETGDISMTGESLVVMTGESTADGAIVMAGEASMVMRGAQVGAEEDDGPAWWHGTSRAKLKNPWGKKKRKKVEECVDDDWEVLELARIAMTYIYSNQRATGILARTSSSSRVGVPVCPEVGHA